MAKNQKRITGIGEQLENHLRLWCWRIPPGKRITVILTFLSLFAGLSLYITFSSLFSFGDKEREKFNFKHIEGLQLELKDKRIKPESLQRINKFQYERNRD
ncbi:TraL conjugative transposon family protein [Maribellus maritimus]|uniref:TraL conjugative transposon family protein n=1 Tax=Maribellus maritimus TaxID=2870838 RepID=UPI001EEACB4B|nr:TraL conjugative transposon family protein [Maribellus maritimus]MCG6190004.1 TraL conjugative transposon family protein [Maribellus maritimus]